MIHFLGALLGFTLAVLAFIYLYMKNVTYNYWRKQRVEFEKPVVPVGNLAAVLLGKINAGTEKIILHSSYG